MTTEADGLIPDNPSDAPIPKAKRPPRRSPYDVWIEGFGWIDYYDLWDAIMEGRIHQPGDSALAHGFKKMLAPGERSGGKSRLQDLKDIRWSADRAIEQMVNKGL